MHVKTDRRERTSICWSQYAVFGARNQHRIDESDYGTCLEEVVVLERDRHSSEQGISVGTRTKRVSYSRMRVFEPEVLRLIPPRLAIVHDPLQRTRISSILGSLGARNSPNRGHQRRDCK
jgi:hypothetical protein